MKEFEKHIKKLTLRGIPNLKNVAIDKVNIVEYDLNGNALENTELDNINIFPIPSTYNVTIISEHHEEVHALLSDINGREVKKFKFTNSTTLNLSNLEKGIYLLTLQTEKGRLVKRLII
mgnify:CR=1 FL=1